MNKVDLVDVVYHRHGGISRQEAAELVDTILGFVKNVLATGQRMHLSGFGSFQVVERNERLGRNPHTGDTITLPARHALVFRPSPLLVELLNEARLDRAVGE